MNLISRIKSRLKPVLRALGLLGIARKMMGWMQVGWFQARTASPSILRRELQYRLLGSPDGHPLPPLPLVYLVVGHIWYALYLDGGKELADGMRRWWAGNGIDPGSFRAILDLGCGCGRIIRHFKDLEGVEIHGSDYNPKLVAWCQENLPFARFSVNDLRPPLSHPEGTFDFIYARSVLTHLPEDLQIEWMAEFHRLLRAGGILYFSTVGEAVLHELSPEQQADFHAGRLVALHPEDAGSNLCGTRQSRKHVEERLLDGFELLDFIPGSRGGQLVQDIYYVRKRPLDA